jgi:hypothetical protein
LVLSILLSQNDFFLLIPILQINTLLTAEIKYSKPVRD